ncbi:hypothetical protein BD779DRAFT_1566528 [Infundibulicybe gibba]|nr:hypothetical protein BD779DRAFT_1566528 [Infundibulicybe gibba]
MTMASEYEYDGIPIVAQLPPKFKPRATFVSPDTGVLNCSPQDPHAHITHLPPPETPDRKVTRECREANARRTVPTLANIAPSAPPTAPIMTADWHPAKAFEACNHTCKHTNTQNSRRSKPLLACPLWPAGSSGLTRHARNENLHLHCTKGCPANPRRKPRPILIRDVSQAEWTEWAPALFDELHDKLDRELGGDHPDVDFNRLEDWMVPIPDDRDSDSATVAGSSDDEGGASTDEDRRKNRGSRKRADSSSDEDDGKDRRRRTKRGSRKRPRVYPSDQWG